LQVYKFIFAVVQIRKYLFAFLLFSANSVNCICGGANKEIIICIFVVFCK